MRGFCCSSFMITVLLLSGCQNTTSVPVSPFTAQPVTVIKPSEGVTITPYQPDEIKRQRL